MSKVSILKSEWIDLVFEGKNKEYGAYQLRQDDSKTTITAFFYGLLLIAAISGSGMLFSSFTSKPIPPEPIICAMPIVTVHLNEVKPKKVIPLKTKQVAAAKNEIKTKDLVNIEIVKPKNADEITENKNLNVPTSDKGELGKGIPTNDGEEKGTAIIPVPEVKGPEGPVSPTALDKLPEFPGGISKFYTYVGNNFEKIEIDEERTIRVYVSFVIERDGSMTDIQVKKDPGYGLGKEAIRVLKSLKTKWVPGILDGKPVRTSYNLPITVQMN
jgi:protein TonB